MFPLLYLTEPERPGKVQILTAMAPIVTFINMFGETFNGFHPTDDKTMVKMSPFLVPKTPRNIYAKNTQFLVKVMSRGLNFRKIKTSSFKMK